MVYQDQSLLGKLKRFIGIRDGYQICTDCKKPFFNLCKAEVCYPCWSKPTNGEVCRLCNSTEHRVCDCPMIGGYAITQELPNERQNLRGDKQ